MSKRKVIIFLTSALLSTPALADPLAGMAGSWAGSGWARDGVKGPREKIRCKLTNTYDAVAQSIKVSGRCAVPGRKIALAGNMRGRTGSDRITGRWFNPDGLGSTAITGVQRDNIVAFTFQATDPASGAIVSQTVEWQVTDDALELRSSDRAQPDVILSELTFSR